MSACADIAERHTRILAQMAEQGAALCADLHRRALAAADNAEAAMLASAFHRVSRAVRQTLALDLKLLRDHRALASEQALRETLVGRQTRRREVRAAAQRLIWTEHEPPEQLLCDLDDWLDEAQHDDDFTEQPVEKILARLTKDLDLDLQLNPPLDPPPLGVAREARGAGSQSDPVGEGDREAVEGVARTASPTSPLGPAAWPRAGEPDPGGTAPTDGEHLPALEPAIRSSA